MSNLITKETSREEWIKQYKNYPATLEGGLEEKPYAESRILPIFYEIPMNSKVLDIGCNDGTFMQILVDKRKCDVFGVDVSEVMIEECKKKGLNVILTNGEKLPFDDESFDAVTLMEVLVHVMDQDFLLSEIKRVLKPNGMLLGSTPHENLERYSWDDKRLHRRYYNEKELEDQLRNTFPSVHIKTLTGGQFAVSMSNSFLSDQPCEILFKCGSSVGSVGWNAALKDRSVLRAWFGMCMNPGTFYYRMRGYCDKMQKLGAETFYEPYDPEDMEAHIRWQQGVSENPDIKGRPLKPLVVDDLDRILSVADISVWQITAFRGVLAFLRCAKDKFKRPIVTEIDDWVFDLPSYNLAHGAFQPNSDYEKTAYQQLQMSDYLICSTEFIKENLLKVFPDKNVFVVKNSIDFDIYDNLEPSKTFETKKDGVIRIGYTGCGNHSGDLELVKEPILALLSEFENLEFILPMPFESWADVEHPRVLNANRWVSLDKYPSMIKGWEMDIGIAPLMDHNGNRAKSNLRWLEYSALKIPTVASNIYPFKNSIKDGKDGVICKNDSNSWYEALKGLILDKGRRASIGENAYKKVKKDYNMDDVSKSYLSILKGIKDNEFKRTTGRVRKASLRSK